MKRRLLLVIYWPLAFFEFVFTGLAEMVYERLYQEENRLADLRRQTTTTNTGGEP